MNYHAHICWNENDSNLNINLELKNPCCLKGAIYNATGRCIAHLFNRAFNTGKLKLIKRMKQTSKGLYTMKINSVEGDSMIRFIVS